MPLGDLGNLHVGIEVDLSGLSTGLAKAQAEMKAAADSMSSDTTSRLGQVRTAYEDAGAAAETAGTRVVNATRSSSNEVSRSATQIRNDLGQVATAHTEVGRVAGVTSTQVQAGLRAWSQSMDLGRQAANLTSTDVQRGLRDWAAAQTALGSDTEGVLGRIGSLFAGLRTNIDTHTTAIRSRLGTLGADAFAPFRAGLSDIGNFFTSAFARMEPQITSARNSFENLGTRVRSIATDIGGVFEGPLSRISSLFGLHLGNASGTTVTHGGIISGALRDTARLGEAAATDLGRGVDAGVGEAGKALDDAAKSAENEAGVVQKAIGGMLTGFGSLVSAVPSLGGVGQIFTQMGSSVSEAGAGSTFAILGIVYALILLAGEMSFFTAQAVGAIVILGVFTGAMIGAAAAAAIALGGIGLVAGAVVYLASSYAGWANSAQNVQTAQSSLTSATTAHNNALADLKHQQDAWNQSATHSQTQLDSLQRAQQQVKTTGDALTQAQGQYNDAVAKSHNPLNTLTTDLNGMKNAWGAAAVPLAGPILNTIDQMIPPVQQIGLGILQWFAGIEPDVLIGVKNAFNDILSVISALQTPFRDFFTIMGQIASSPGFAQIEAALQELATSTIIGLLNNLERVSNWFVNEFPSYGPVVGSIFSAIGQFVQGFISHLVDIANWFVQHWPQIISWTSQLSSAFEMLLPIITPIVGAIAGFIGKLLGMQVVQEGIKDLAIVFGVIFLGAILVVIGIIGTLAATFFATAFIIGIAVSTISAHWIDFTNFLGAAVGVIGGILGAIGNWFGSVFSAIGTWISGVIGWFGALFSAIGSTVQGIIGWFAALFSAIGGVFSAIGSAIQGVIGWFGALFSAIGGAFSAIGSAVQGVLGWFGALFSGIGSIVNGIWTTIVNIFSAIGNWLSTWGLTIFFLVTFPFWLIVGVIATVASNIWTTLTTTWNAILAVAGPIFSGIYNTIAGWFNAAWSFIANLWSFVWGWLSGLWNGIWGTAGAIFAAIYNTVSFYFTSAWNFISYIWSYAWSWLSGVWNGIWGTAIAWLTNVWTSIVQFFTNIWNWLANLWSYIWTWLSGTWNGIWGTAVAWLTNVYNTVVSWFTAAWNFLAGLWNYVWSWLNSTWNGILGSAIYYFMQIYQTVQSWMNAVQGWVQQVGNSLAGIMHNALSALGNTMKGDLNWIISNVLNGFLNAVWWGFHNLVHIDLPIHDIGTFEQGGVVGANGKAVPGYAAGGIPSFASGTSNAGVYSKPTFLVAEGRAPESVIPWDSAHRNRAVELWNLTGEKLGVLHGNRTVGSRNRMPTPDVRGYSEGGIIAGSGAAPSRTGMGAGPSLDGLPTSGHGGQCLAFLSQWFPQLRGIPAAKDAAKLINTMTPKPGEVAINTSFAPYGHAALVINPPNMILDSNWNEDEMIHIHPLADMKAAGFIDFGAALGTLAGGAAGAMFDVAGFLQGAASDIVNKVSGSTPGWLAGVPATLLGMVVGPLGQWIIANFGSQLASQFSGAVSGFVGGAVSVADVTRLALQAGWSPGDIPTLLRAIAGESSFNPNAIGPAADNDGGSIGLLQIQPYYWPQFDKNKLKDPLYNLEAGLVVFRSQGWGAWHALEQGGILPTGQMSIRNKQPIAFDNGYNVIPPGLSVVYNGRNTPEALQEVGRTPSETQGGGVVQHFHGNERVPPDLLTEAFQHADWYWRNQGRGTGG